MEDEEGDEDEEIDEEDLKMYEQFLAQNQKDQQQLAYQGQDHFELEDEEDEDGDLNEMERQLNNQMAGGG